MNIANKIRVIYFFIFCAHAAFIPRLAEYLNVNSIKGWELGLVLSINPALMFLLQPFHGRWSDKTGHKKSLIISCIASMVCFFILWFQKGGVFYISAVLALLSVFYNGIQPIIDAISLKQTNDDKNFSYGSLRVAGAMGWACMGLLIGYVIGNYSINAMFFLAGISLLLSAAITFTLPETVNQQPEEEEKDKSMLALFNNKQVLPFVIVITLVSIFSTAMWNFYSLYMEEIGADSVLSGMGYAFHGLCELPFFFLSAWILKKYGVYPTLIFTILSTAIRMYLYSVVKNPHIALSIELFQGISWSLFWVACVEYINSLVDKSWRATAQSLLYAAYFGIGAIVGNMWASRLHEAMPLSKIFWINAIAVGILSLLMGLHYMYKKSAYQTN